MEFILGVLSLKMKHKISNIASSLPEFTAESLTDIMNLTKTREGTTHEVKKILCICNDNHNGSIRNDGVLIIFTACGGNRCIDGSKSGKRRQERRSSGRKDRD